MTQIWPVKVHTGLRVRMRDGARAMSASTTACDQDDSLREGISTHTAAWLLGEPLADYRDEYPPVVPYLHVSHAMLSTTVRAVDLRLWATCDPCNSHEVPRHWFRATALFALRCGKAAIGMADGLRVSRVQRRGQNDRPKAVPAANKCTLAAERSHVQPVAPDDPDPFTPLRLVVAHSLPAPETLAQPTVAWITGRMHRNPGVHPAGRGQPQPFALHSVQS